MKNIKINKDLITKGKFVLVTAPLVTTILLSGCGFFPNGERARYKNIDTNSPGISDQVQPSDHENSIENNIEFDADSLNVPLKDVGTIDLTNIKITYSSNRHSSFSSFLNNVDVDYVYEDLYNFDDSLAEYNKLNFTNNHDSKLKQLDVNQLYNVIIENNKAYKQINNSSIYKELTSSELRDISNLIITVVNDFVKNNDSISIDRIKCVLSDLKLFKQNSAMSNAFVTDNNCLIISPNMLKFANIMNGDGTKQDVLIHEIIHLLQKGCNCELNINENLKRNFGMSYGFKDIKINSLDISWFYEASAEKNMVNYTGNKPLVYKNMIGYLESISMSNLLKDSYNVNDTEELSFKRTLKDLYNYFGVTSEKEKREILNLMYSLEVMQMAPDKFYELLEEETGNKKDSALIDDVNYTVKGSICETLTKIFYKNLSSSIVNKDVSLGDIFYLISVFENDINNHILYNSAKKYSYNQDFINTYVNIQDSFFFGLSKSTNYTQEEIENSFNNYNSIIKIGEVQKNNYSLNFLNQEKINYLKQREGAFNSIAGPTIRNVAKEFKKQNIQKSV